jgi:caffeoyl-CoA O-methyltransferase
MDIVSLDVQAYAEACTTPEADYLRSVAEKTKATTDASSMMVGLLEGRFLETLVFVSRARRVLEIGTFTGYSALAMAAALPPEGQLVTCEVDPERAAIARRHLQASPWGERVEIRVGPALETLRSLAGEFDLVFIDADKGRYRDYYEATLPLLSAHGLIIVDNVLWSGRVLDPVDDSEDTRAIKDFNRHVREDRRVVCVMLTVRDGVTLVRKAT